ncbi:hypothetical protein SAMN05444412_11540 [Rhodonellum ikkaensis]|uniref:Uncharacterized protein n=1 Tax=Rhodonellum ikkaensis TaxID=336829 RepID=A0A1H3T5A5_9BACT|nr:hypothetical protein SAMN05444412_11540 [Rhodonellum ikkaensis]
MLGYEKNRSQNLLYDDLRITLYEDHRINSYATETH